MLLAVSFFSQSCFGFWGLFVFQGNLGFRESLASEKLGLGKGGKGLGFIGFRFYCLGDLRA